MLTNLLASFKDDEQLLPAIVQDVNSKEVLMLAWVNKEALERTASTKQATFWSRSRKEIWVKGQTSGNKQEVISIKFDCDSDAFLFSVHSHGPACHTGEKSCFYSEIIL
jgi:phosphoribosyl-AMP cyclohydrolase